MELVAGLIGAVVGFVSKAITDVLTERRRREDEKRARLLEAKLRYALDFMEAADRLTRTRQTVSTATRWLEGAKSSGNEEVYERYRTLLLEAREREASASTDAEKAYTAIRLLIPTAAEVARGYLDLCDKADAHPDEKRDAREEARRAADEAIRAALDT